MAETFGHYTLLDRLGSGAIGALYRARDTTSGRTVALRIVRGEPALGPARRAEIEAQLRAAAALSHPNIAMLYEVGEVSEVGAAGEHAGQLFFAQEFVPGQSLARLAEGRPMHMRRAIGYAIEMADALAEAHAMGVEHGHLMASNVMVTPKGRVKLLDVGFAGWTAAGAGEPRSDLSALGALLSELLTGGSSSSPRLPLPGDVAPILAGLASEPVEYASAATAAAALRSLAETLDARAVAAAPPIVAGAGGAGFRVSLPWLLTLLGLVAAAFLVWAATRL